MRKILTTLVAFSVFAPTAAMAEESYLVGMPSTKEFFELADVDTLSKTSDGRLRVWITHYLGDAESSKSGGFERKQLEEYDCKDGRVKTVQSVLYSASGAVVRSSPEKPDYERGDLIIPGTVGEGKLHFACGWPDNKSDYLRVTPELLLSLAKRAVAQRPSTAAPKIKPR